MIQGVIFDMDGLMFDTERIWATLWEPALAGLGLSYKAFARNRKIFHLWAG